jgi:hypothetical protein
LDFLINCHRQEESDESEQAATDHQGNGLEAGLIQSVSQALLPGLSA